jgi:hypothetical protein
MNGQGIDISVIIPVFQAAGVLSDCVKSVKDSILNIEAEYEGVRCQIVFVDDGSTDGSSELCDSLKGESDLVRHTVNAGVSHARNIGMEMAEGRLFTFVDSDDSVERNFLSTLYKAAMECGTPIVAMSEQITDGEVLDGFSYIEKAVLYRDSHVWGKLFDAEYIKESGIRFREGITIGEDMLFLLELSLHAGDHDLISKASPLLYNYYINENGAMKRSFKVGYLDQLLCWQYAEKAMKSGDHIFSQSAYDRLSEIQMMSAMLVASKIAVIDEETRNSLDKDMLNGALNSCEDLIRSAGKLGAGFKRLSAGYKLKVTMFLMSKSLYLNVYGKWKK